MNILHEDLETLPSFTSHFPTEEIYNYRRFLTDEGVSYFTKATDVNLAELTYSYSHIDSIMRYFIYLMHANELFVSTGWEGVKSPKTYFDNLKSQEIKIQRYGLEISDFLTGDSSIFKDKSYRSSFSDLEDFMKIREYLKFDRIGLLVPLSNYEILENLKADSYETGLTSIKYGKDLNINGSGFAYFPISVRREDEKSRITEWRKVCSWILSNLGKKAVITV